MRGIHGKLRLDLRGTSCHQALPAFKPMRARSTGARCE
jgi:hypothetical protein